jgi:molybdopterin molybdotransferase
MISLDEALCIVLAHTPYTPGERIDLEDARSRILAEDVRSDMDMPPFNKSAMDGFACRRDDLDSDLQVIETVLAGNTSQRVIGPGECCRIMTGAPVPEGADCVIKIEDTSAQDNDNVRFTGERTRDNICMRGEDIPKGGIVLRRGELITPQHMSLLASVGCIRPMVASRPGVGIIATGDELVEPDTQPGVAHIRNSNSIQLRAQAQAAGACANYYGIVRDNEKDIEAILKKALAENSIVLLTGGVSMGDTDFVPAVMQTCGLDILFDKVCIKPGMPTTFAASDKALCMGLPGNPVAVFIDFEILLRPFIQKSMGRSQLPRRVYLPLEERLTRKRTERESWMPAIITDKGEVQPCTYHGPAHVGSLHNADALISIPVGVATLEKGEKVQAQLLFR